jgi:Ca-activated chloride channel family protein
LTLAVDVSGSMAAEGRMDYLKRGLLRMVRELKPGDVINVVSFDHRVCTRLTNFTVGRDDAKHLTKAIHGLRPSGRTNLWAGLNEAYELADASYQPTHSNRVVMITDALANEGVTDAEMIGLVSDAYDARRIRLSGIGVGHEFNDHLLDRMTERGRGAYVFLGSEAEVDAVFGDRFTSLVETTANDVHFRLHLPPSLRLARFHGEEASTYKDDVQAIHYFADTSQLFLSDLEAWQGQLRPQDTIKVEIEYLDAETGDERVEETVFPIGAITTDGRNVHKGRLVTRWAELLTAVVARAAPAGYRPIAGGWDDPAAWEICAQGRAELAADGSGTLAGDPEVQRLRQLWEGYCARFGTARPTRKDDRGGWPGAR